MVWKTCQISLIDDLAVEIEAAYRERADQLNLRDIPRSWRLYLRASLLYLEGKRYVLVNLRRFGKTLGMDYVTPNPGSSMK